MIQRPTLVALGGNDGALFTIFLGLTLETSDFVNGHIRGQPSAAQTH